MTEPKWFSTANQHLIWLIWIKFKA